MASKPFLVPTARYKRATKSGDRLSFVTGAEEIEDNGDITSVFWSKDAAGTQVINTFGFDQDFYLQVRTINAQGSVTVTFDALNLVPSDFEKGSIQGAFLIPLTYNSTTKVGSGYSLFRLIDEEIMAFGNATWQNLTASRTFDTVYTNNTPYPIQVNITVNVADVSGYAISQLIVDDVSVAGARTDVSSGSGQTSLTLTAIIPIGSTYKLTRGSGVSLIWWTELRR